MFHRENFFLYKIYTNIWQLLNQYVSIFKVKFCIIKFAEAPLLDGLYWEKWYNEEPVATEELNFLYYENKMLGVPRLRQLQVRDDSCTVHDDFAKEITACYASYSGSIENTKDLAGANNNPNNLTA